MSKDRMEALSDGVIAIIITIMVLDMKVESINRPGEELVEGETADTKPGILPPDRHPKP